MTEDEEILQEFLVESYENLDQLDHELVELELQPGSRPLLASIFRTIHTIKGTSGFLALHRLETLTHAGENLLSKLRDGELQSTAESTSVLLRMVDAVRGLLELVENTGSDTGSGDDPEVVAAAIVSFLTSAHPGFTEVSPAGPAVDPRVTAIQATPELSESHESHESPDAFESSEASESESYETSAARADVVRSVPPPAAMISHRSADPSADRVAEAADGGRSVVESSVRVDVELLDTLVQLVGELVLTRNQIVQKISAHGDSDLQRASQRLNSVASELQSGVMKTRMQPIGQVWAKMPRVVRDLSQQLGRSVNLKMEGHDTELDRTLLEAIRDPLTHLVRNALDHGVEPPAERSARGKPETGHVTLRAFHENGQVVVEIADDGRGIDVQRVGAVALQRGVVTADELRRMDQHDIEQLIFEPGFSTAAQVTNVSGRGVGMDVVRTNIERIGGTVDLTSHAGSGTICRVRIPLTLAIIPALLIEEGSERYAIPQVNLVELVRLEGEELRRNVEYLAGAPVLRLRGRLLPLIRLATALGMRPRNEVAMTVVVLRADDVDFGLIVSEVHDTQEIVVKPIGRQVKSLPMYAGATIMGDGRVSLILDVSGLARDLITSRTRVAAEPSAAVESTTPLLVVEAAPGHRAALALSAVSRLEEFDVKAIERAGVTEAVQYRGDILQLVRLAPTIGLQASPTANAHVSVVVHECNHHRVGIVIDHVLDIVETSLATSPVGRRPGVSGSAVISGKVTDVVDLDEVMALAGSSL